MELCTFCGEEPIDRNGQCETCNWHDEINRLELEAEASGTVVDAPGKPIRWFPWELEVLGVV